MVDGIEQLSLSRSLSRCSRSIRFPYVWRRSRSVSTCSTPARLEGGNCSQAIQRRQLLPWWRWRTTERANPSGSGPANARSMSTAVISGAESISSTAASSCSRDARAAARAGKNARRAPLPQRGRTTLFDVARSHSGVSRRPTSTRAPLGRRPRPYPLDGLYTTTSALLSRGPHCASNSATCQSGDLWNRTDDSGRAEQRCEEPIEEHADGRPMTGAITSAADRWRRAAPPLPPAPLSPPRPAAPACLRQLLDEDLDRRGQRNRAVASAPRTPRRARAQECDGNDYEESVKVDSWNLHFAASMLF